MTIIAELNVDENMIPYISFTRNLLSTSLEAKIMDYFFEEIEKHGCVMVDSKDNNYGSNFIKQDLKINK